MRFGRGATDGLCVLRGGAGQQGVVDRRVGVPHIELPHPGERLHSFSIRPRARAYHLLALARPKAVGAGGNREAGDESLDIPFPRPRQRLVEVVDVKDEVAFGTGEQTEVRQMRVAAQLDIEPGVLVPGHVRGHDERYAAEERERRRQNSAVSDRQKLADPRAVLRLQQCDRIGTVFVDNEVRESRPRHRRSAGTTEVVPFLRGEIHVRLPSAWGRGDGHVLSIVPAGWGALYFGAEFGRPGQAPGTTREVCRPETRVRRKLVVSRRLCMSESPITFAMNSTPSVPPQHQTSRPGKTESESSCRASSTSSRSSWSWFRR